MVTGFDIQWAIGQNTSGRGQNTMGKGVNIPPYACYIDPLPMVF
jgi:hypothetical protein